MFKLYCDLKEGYVDALPGPHNLGDWIGGASGFGVEPEHTYSLEAADR